MIKVEGNKVTVLTDKQRTCVDCSKPKVVGTIISILHDRIARQEGELSHVYNRLQEAHNGD